MSKFSPMLIVLCALVACSKHNSFPSLKELQALPTEDIVARYGECNKWQWRQINDITDARLGYCTNVSNEYQMRMWKEQPKERKGKVWKGY